MNREIKFRAWDGSDKYIAGDDGKIYSTDYNHTGKTRALKPYKDQDGYNLVVLNINGKRIVKSVHRLIALAFHGEKPTNKHQVNHINRIRTDNRPENLEYLTSRDNTLHGWANGRTVSKEARENAKKRFSGTNNPKAKINEAIVLSIKQLRLKGGSLKSISEKHSISVSQVSAIINNKFWKNGN